MNRIFALAVAAAISMDLAACVTATPPEPTHTYVPTTLTADQIAAVKAGTKLGLKDPDSARFDHPILAVMDETGQIWVCSSVNAKNSFGGYTGDKPFIGGFAGDKFAVSGYGGEDTDNTVIFNSCAEHSMVLSWL